MSDAQPLLIAATAVLGIVALYLAILSFRASVTAPDRTYMDPLSGPVRAVWPLVLFVSFYFSRLLTIEYLEKLQRLLQHQRLLDLIARCNS